MILSEFDYKLPEKLIAIEPALERDKARLLVMEKKSGRLVDDYFYNLDKHLKAGDVLVFNDSKVIPARLRGSSNGREYEVLLVKKLDESRWECWVRPGKKAKVGTEFEFGDKLIGILAERHDDVFIFDFNLRNDEFYQEINKIGQMPLPPYILKARKSRHHSEYEEKDSENYQTIFAKKTGSVAAPTAGLHFSEEILARLNKNGIQIEKVTLHVGLGTFQPVTTERVKDFQIHREHFELSKETADRLNRAKREGRRIIAVGTTSVRVLETVVKRTANLPSLQATKRVGSQELIASAGETNIYIYPGYDFKFVDGMITNFHLPKSSLLLLVSAFAGKGNIQKAYEHAIREKYRFYSYGDGMLIL